MGSLDGWGDSNSKVAALILDAKKLRQVKEYNLTRGVFVKLFLMSATLALLTVMQPACAQNIQMAPNGTYVGGTPQMAPNGSYVGGTPHMAPNGSYVGGTPQMAPNGSYVGGTPHMAPNGSYVGGTPHMAPDGSYVGTRD